MKFRIVGADMYTGDDVEMVVNAATREAAGKKAAKASIIILSIDPEDDLHADNTTNAPIFGDGAPRVAEPTRPAAVSQRLPQQRRPTAQQRGKPRRKRWLRVLIFVLVGVAVGWVWFTYGSAEIYRWSQQWAQWIYRWAGWVWDRASQMIQQIADSFGG